MYCGVELSNGKKCQRRVREECVKCYLHSKEPVVKLVLDKHDIPKPKSIFDDEMDKKDDGLIMVHLQNEIMRLHALYATLQDPLKKAQQIYFEKHKDDEDIINEVRDRLIRVNLYVSDNDLPLNIIKMATDAKFNIEYNTNKADL
jgi:hypothetical protein